MAVLYCDHCQNLKLFAHRRQSSKDVSALTVFLRKSFSRHHPVEHFLGYSLANNITL